MSGGHWNYEQDRIRTLVDQIYNDESLAKEFPEELAELIKEVGTALAETIHDLDWHISGDTRITNKYDPAVKLLNKLKHILRNHHAL